jgi:hypothetical protein
LTYSLSVFAQRRWRLGDHALEPGVVPGGVLVVGTLQQDASRLGRQVPERHLRRDRESLAELPQELVIEDVHPLAAAAPGVDRAVSQRQRGVRHEQFRVEFQDDSQPAAGRAGAVGRVETEDPRLEFRETDPTVRAGVLLGKDLIDPRGAVARLVRHHDQAVAQAKGRLEAVGQPRADRGLDRQTVDHRLDGVPGPLVHLGRVVDVIGLAVDPHADESFALDPLEDVLVLALLAADQGAEDHELRLGRPLQDRVHHLFHGLLADPAAAPVAERHPDPREEHAQVVINLGDRPDGGPGVGEAASLLDGDGRRQARRWVHVAGLLHLFEELPGVGGEALHVACAGPRRRWCRRRARLAGAGHTGDYDQLLRAGCRYRCS